MTKKKECAILSVVLSCLSNKNLKIMIIIFVGIIFVFVGVFVVDVMRRGRVNQVVHWVLDHVGQQLTRFVDET